MQNVNVKINNEVLSTFEKIERCKQINQERLGETMVNNQGEIMFIVEYNSSTDVTVQFESTGELVKCSYGNFKGGLVKSHFTPSVYGVGIVGLEPTRDENSKRIPSYQCWKEMLRRVYSAKFQEKKPSYKGVTICKEWLTYSNFKSWYDENYYEIPELGNTQLDKDWLSGDCKTYSPETCVFVPQALNVLIVKRDKLRGNLPIGVSFNKRDGIYQTICNNGKGKSINLGSFKTPEEAFEVYKQYKEDLIKQIANEYKEKIPSQLYTAMMSYTVNIND